MSFEVHNELPFYPSTFYYVKGKIMNELCGATSYNTLETALEWSKDFAENKAVHYAEYEAYRKEALMKWLEKQKRDACVQSAGTSDHWKISFYFENWELKGFRENEIELIKQAALDRLNQDETVQKYGTFTKVIKVEKDICQSTAFICSC